MTCNRPNTSQDFCTHSNSKCCTATLPLACSYRHERSEGRRKQQQVQSEQHALLQGCSKASLVLYPLHKTTATCHKTCVRHAKACSSCQKKHVKDSRANLKGANFSQRWGRSLLRSLCARFVGLRVARKRFFGLRVARRSEVLRAASEACECWSASRRPAKLRARGPFKAVWRLFASTFEPRRLLELRPAGYRIDSAPKCRILTHVSKRGL